MISLSPITARSRELLDAAIKGRMKERFGEKENKKKSAKKKAD